MNTIYLIEANFGRHGRAFIETDRDQNSRASVIELIRSGEVDPVKVLEVNEDEGTCRDVTADILNEVAVSLVPIFRDVDPLAAKFDHARDLRKHGSA
jgi:hypothetical protein